MSHLMHVVQKRLVRLVIAGGLLTSAIGAPLVLASGTAQAASCGTATVSGVACTLTGTLGLTAGTLSLTPPSALAWSSPVTGLDLSLVDPTDQSYAVDDATGSGVGWHVTASATTFSSATPLATLPTTTLSTNGSASSLTSGNAPTYACASGASCTPPTNQQTYPVYFTTATTTPTPMTIFDTKAATGLGSITIGIGTNPVGWWLNVPANQVAATYTSTITMQLISAP
jgi:hypothetical protein